MQTAAPSIAARLARLTCGLGARPLPPAIEGTARLCLVDFLAAVLAADAHALTDRMAPVFGAGDARLLHDGRHISEAGATYLHGYLSTVEDIDDAHALAAGMHLSATVLPVTLALAQGRGASQARVLRAIVAGYEVGGRLVRAMDSGLRKRGFHSTGAIGPFAACAAAGVMLDLDETQLAHGFGIAASQAGGLFAFLPTGASVRHTHAANAGLAGLLSATAAAAGVTGPRGAFEGPDGFIAPYAGVLDEGFVVAADPWDSGAFEIDNAYHKRFNACGHAVPAITLTLEHRTRLLPQIDRIAAIRVEGYRASAALTACPALTVGEAKFSLPAIVALALLEGNVSAREMQADVLARPDVVELSRRISVQEDPALTAAFPARRSGRMTIDFLDGERVRFETDSPIGMPGNALDFATVAGKFLSIAPERLGEIKARAMLDRVEELTDCSSHFRLS